jgi:hypothetical protein
MHLVVRLSTGTDTASCRDTKTLFTKTVLTKTVLTKTVLTKTEALQSKAYGSVCANVSVFALHDSKRPSGRSLSLASFVLWQSLLSALSSISRSGLNIRLFVAEVKEQMFMNRSGLDPLAIMHQKQSLARLGFAKFSGLVHAAVEKVAEDGTEPVHIYQEGIVSLDGFK